MFCSVNYSVTRRTGYRSALINGKGKHPGNEYPYLKSCLHIFTVNCGQVYCFRLIGAINNFTFRFSIDEHQLWVVGTDGYWVDPVAVDYITLQSGERYDFLLITQLRMTSGCERRHKRLI